MIQAYAWQQPIINAVTKSLSTNRFAINASGTGSGKTVMALTSLKDLMVKGEVSQCLVIAPKVALSQWVSTAKEMGFPDSSIYGCINPEQISKPSGCKFYTREEGWKLPKNTLVIWDEPHRNASGEKSKATEAMARLHAYKSLRLLAMSATIADSPLKLRALGFWAGFHTFSFSNFRHWCSTKGCFGIPFMFTRNKRKARQYMLEIREGFGDSFVAIPISQIPNFPEQTLDVLRIDLEKSDKKNLEIAYKEMSDRLKSVANSELAQLGRLREQIEFCKANVMADLAYSCILNGKSAVIFCNYTSARERITNFLTSKGVEVAQIYGGQKDDERQLGIDRFQANECHAMVVMTAAGGAALSLHDMKHERQRESFITPSFNAAEVKQALGRIRRCNGTNVEQHFVLAANTIEDRVARRLEAKIDSIDAINDADLDFTK